MDNGHSSVLNIRVCNFCEGYNQYSFTGFDSYRKRKTGGNIVPSVPEFILPGTVMLPVIPFQLGTNPAVKILIEKPGEVKFGFFVHDTNKIFCLGDGMFMYCKRYWIISKNKASLFKYSAGYEGSALLSCKHRYLCSPSNSHHKDRSAAFCF